jgi:hypothetical protein
MRPFKEPGAYMIKRRNKKGKHTKPVKGKVKAKPRLVAKTKARQRKRAHRVARGKPKPGLVSRLLIGLMSGDVSRARSRGASARRIA